MWNLNGGTQTIGIEKKIVRQTFGPKKDESEEGFGMRSFIIYSEWSNLGDRTCSRSENG